MAFRDYILNNIGWKLLSLLLGALTWLTIQTAFKKEQESPVVPGASSRSFTLVPVTLMSSAANTGRFTVTPSLVTVTVSGKQEDVKELRAQDIKAFVDVTEIGDEMKTTKPIQVRVPRDFSAAAEPLKASVERTGDSK